MKPEISHKSSAHVDKGWAWVVCIAGHFCTALTVGYALSLGVFFIEWKEQLDLSTTSSSWVAGLPHLVASPLSLFMSAITLRLGIRRVTMFGSVVSGLATILGSFSTKVWHLYLSATISGLGLVTVVSPALVILSHYFRRRFALANGLIILGLSTALTVFPPFSRLLIESYGWRGAMLIGGAIQMNSVAACALFRPLKEGPDKVTHGRRRLEGLDGTGAIDMVIETVVSSTLRKVTQETQTTDLNRKTIKTENEQPNDSLKKSSERKFETEGFIDTIQIEEIVSDQQLDMKLYIPESVQIQQTGFVEPQNEGPAQGKVSRQDTNVNNICRTAATSNQNKDNCGRRKFRNHFGLFDVFSNSLVMLIVFAIGFLTTALNSIVIHLPPRVKEAGWSEDQGALVLSIFAIVSIVTRATHGWFVDRNYIGAFKLQSITLLGCSVVTFMNPVSDSYIYLVGNGVLLGGLGGIATPLAIFTARRVARPSQVPSTMGLVWAAKFLCCGTGSIIAGKIYDATGNYVAPFLAAGAMILPAFILNGIVACSLQEKAND